MSAFDELAGPDVSLLTGDHDYVPVAILREAVAIADRFQADRDGAEAVLREIRDNSSGQIEDPHFRHWAAVTIASYFSARDAGN